ncbi:bifunctional nuclease-domain-containing protein [Dunaliella salina]|uniref:Bifunctional nuclease-domain-containing protein n=1 Tax=Dunaliella salina TaxID=3046 RepID=A0ABQ7GPF3_DUNSA|nr:bifunctional nuclease-domain-containing protein [Dunaliella salina]|eukprot:KAF5836482.1 bifunctional nuclease-domain-containing protein [Dunaliella salina]
MLAGLSNNPSLLPASCKQSSLVCPPPPSSKGGLCSIGGIGCLIPSQTRTSAQQGFGSRIWLSRPCASRRRREDGRAVRVCSSSSSKGGDTSDVQVEVQTIQQSGNSGNAIVFLALIGSKSLVLPVHIGEQESRALQMEILGSTRIRPLTHDVAKNIIGALGFKITRICITDIVHNTYYARVYMARVDADGKPQGDEIDVDARPSDAINLAQRAKAPMYVSEKVALTAIEPEKMLSDFAAAVLNPSAPGAQNDIIKSVKETLAHFEDPCIMLQLQMDLAVQQQRFEDANACKARLTDMKLHSQPLRLVVAMEAALADTRYEEAARLRDEYLELAEQQHKQQQDTEESSQHGYPESQKKC